MAGKWYESRAVDCEAIPLFAAMTTAPAARRHLGQAAGHTPRDHGFDRFLGIPFSTDMGRLAAGSGAGVAEV